MCITIRTGGTIMKTFKKALALLLSVILVFSVCSVAVAQPANGEKKSELSFAVLSDPHYYPEVLTGNNCQAWLDYCNINSKLFRYSDAIVRTALDTMFIRNPGLKYIFVPGDLTKDSEYEAHTELAKIFLEYEEKYDVEFLVIDGNHDINSPRAETFVNGVKEQGRSITVDEFRDVYAELGYDLAVNEYAERGANIPGQLSYAADLEGGYRLIAIDSCIYSFGEPDSYKTEGMISDELMAWIKAMTDDALAKGMEPMIMVHHSLSAHMEVEPSITHAFPLNDYMNKAEQFASWGINYAFTGHLHTDDTASVINDDGDVLYDVETSSVTGFPNTYREITVTSFDNGESEMKVDSVDFDAAKQFTFDGVTYEKSGFKYKAFSLCYGGATSADGKPDCAEFLMAIVETYLGGILEDIKAEGSVGAYLKTLGVDLEKILGDFLSPYLGDGISLGGYNIFSVENIMWFIDDLLGQVYDLYIGEPDALMNLLGELVAKLVNYEVSSLPCTKFIDTFGFGNPDKAGTLGDAVLSTLVYWTGGNEDISDDAFMQDVIKNFDQGDTFKGFFDLVVDVLLHDLIEDSLLAKLEIRIDKLLADDEISRRLGEGVNYLLNYVLRGDFTYMNLVNTIFYLEILPFKDLYDVLDQLLMKKYLTDSQFESLGIFVAYVLTDFTSDTNPVYKGDYDVTYSSAKVEVPVTKENFRIPTMVSVTLGDKKNESANISWFSKATVGGDIEIYKADSEPAFTGVSTEGVTVETETVTRSYPGIDLGFIGFFTYEYPMNRHTVKLEGLEEGATYYFRVGDAERGWWSDTGSVRVADGSDNVTFLHMTDPQSQNERQYNRAWAKVLESAFANYPDADFIINSGDLVDHGDNQKQWAWMFNTGSDYLMNTYMMPASGNHEGMGTNATDNFFVLPNAPEQDKTSGVYYSFDYNNVHIAVLNTNDLDANEALSADQVDWLTKDMLASNADWKFVMLHKALYSQGSHYADDDVCTMREQLGELMPNLGIDLVFQGHDHVYMRTGSLDSNILMPYDKVYLNYGDSVYRTQVQPEGTTYVISGTAGVKTYIQNDVTLTDEYFPRGEKILSVDFPMYSAVRIEDGILYFDAYEVTADGSEKVDSFAIQKDKTQGDINTEYVEPETPDEGASNGTIRKILDALFRILRILLGVLGLYIAPIMKG